MDGESMIRIAICDDNKYALEKEDIRRWAKKRGTVLCSWLIVINPLFSFFDIAKSKGGIELYLRNIIQWINSELYLIRGIYDLKYDSFVLKTGNNFKEISLIKFRAIINDSVPFVLTIV